MSVLAHLIEWKECAWNVVHVDYTPPSPLPQVLSSILAYFVSLSAWFVYLHGEKNRGLCIKGHERLDLYLRMPWWWFVVVKIPSVKY